MEVEEFIFGDTVVFVRELSVSSTGVLDILSQKLDRGSNVFTK